MVSTYISKYAITLTALNYNDCVFHGSYQYMTLTHLGECCNEVNIQSDGPASGDQDNHLGDYKKYGNDSNVYRNIMNSERFLFKASDGSWRVCTKYQCSLMQ